MGMKHTKGVVNFLFAKHPVFTGLHATGIVHGKGCGGIYLGEIQLIGMSKQLLHIHESIVGDGWPIAIHNTPDDFSHIQCCYLIDFKLPNYRADIFGVNTLWNVWVLEPVFKIMLKPVFKQVIYGLYARPLAALSFR